MGTITKYNSDGSVTHYDDSGNVQLPGTSGSWSPDMSGVSGGTPDLSTKSTPFNTPPLSDAAKQYTPQPQSPLPGTSPDISIPSKTPLEIGDDSVPGSDSQLPGVKDLYMKNLYAKNAAASDNMNKILASLPSTTGDGGWGALQGMFDAVLKLSKGVGQKNMATEELARAQQQLQEHERNQAQAEYWRKRGESDQTRAGAQDKKANSYGDKVDNDNANKQRDLDLKQRKLDLDQQLANGKLTKQEYDNRKKQLEIEMLNPKAASTPPPATSTGTPPVSPPATSTGTPPVSPPETPPPAQSAPINPSINDGKNWHRGGPDNAMMYPNPDGTYTDTNGRKRDMNGVPI